MKNTTHNTIDELEKLESSYFVAGEKERAKKVRLYTLLLLDLQAENELENSIESNIKLIQGVTLITHLLLKI